MVGVDIRCVRVCLRVPGASCKHLRRSFQIECKTASFKKRSAIFFSPCQLFIKKNKKTASLLHFNCVSELRESAWDMHIDSWSCFHKERNSQRMLSPGFSFLYPLYSSENEVNKINASRIIYLSELEIFHACTRGENSRINHAWSRPSGLRRAWIHVCTYSRGV